MKGKRDSTDNSSFHQMRRVCFVTGTRAEFGLTESTLRAIASHPKLKLQIIATGMHLDRSRGNGLRDIRDAGFTVDRTVPWPVKNDPVSTARNAGVAIAKLADAFDELRSDVVLVVGDRVEAFAAASAAHISGRIVAHVHGGDRALGQVDDALRHSITKLAHVHLPATSQSAQRIRRLGEDAWRIHCVGAPGIDGICEAARSVAAHMRRTFALVVLHPTDAMLKTERQRARLLIGAIRKTPIPEIVIVYPNNDPGAAAIAKCWDDMNSSRDRRFSFYRNLPRAAFLGLIRDSAMLIGNSSSGIIEAASFGTPVIDIGDRQAGRERSGNVRHVPFERAAICHAIVNLWNDGRAVRFRGRNVYGGNAAGVKIAGVLAGLSLDQRLRRKLIAY